MEWVTSLFEKSGIFGLINFKRITTPFSIVKYVAPRGRPDFKCVYIFGIRVAYFTT